MKRVPNPLYQPRPRTISRWPRGLVIGMLVLALGFAIFLAFAVNDVLAVLYATVSVPLIVWGDRQWRSDAARPGARERKSGQAMQSPKRPVALEHEERELFPVPDWAWGVFAACALIGLAIGELFDARDIAMVTWGVGIVAVVVAGRRERRLTN